MPFRRIEYLPAKAIDIIEDTNTLNDPKLFSQVSITDVLKIASGQMKVMQLALNLASNVRSMTAWLNPKHLMEEMVRSTLFLAMYYIPGISDSARNKAYRDYYAKYGYSGDMVNNHLAMTVAALQVTLNNNRGVLTNAQINKFAISTIFHQPDPGVARHR